MTTVPAPYTAVANTKPTAANHNTWHDAILQLQGGAPSAGALDYFTGRLTVAQALTTSGTAYPLLLDTEDVDAANGHSTVTLTTRYVIATAGYIRADATVTYAANATGNRWVWVAINGTLIPGCLVDTAAANVANGTALHVGRGGIAVAIGDYVEVYGQQSSTASLNVTVASLHVKWEHQ